jgi:hypothetical protein
VENLIIDWFNRDQAFNEKNISRVRGGQADTATIPNVLNVIQKQENRDLVVRQAADAIKENGTAYFYIYEGDGSGSGKETTSGWQENRKTQDYISDISKHFTDVIRQGQMIVAKGPIKEEADMAPEPENSLGYDIVNVVEDIKAGRTDGPLRAINNVVKQSTELRDRIKRESARRKKPRVRGQAPILERIARERTSGKISEETAQALTDFVNTIRPEAIGDTALSIRGAGSVSNFDFGDSLVSFYLTQDKPEMGARIGIHEFWHGLSRFLPDSEVSKMSKDYIRELSKYIDKNPWFLAFVGRYSLTPEQYEDYKIFNPIEADTKLSPVFGANGEIERYNIIYDEESYRYIMLDEWIAESMTDLVRQRQGIPDTMLGKLAKIFMQFVELIESKLGFDAYESFYQLVTDPNKKLQLYRTGFVAPPLQIYQPQTYDYAKDIADLVRYNTLAPEP